MASSEIVRALPTTGPRTCVLALDLGTTAFKAAPVAAVGSVGEVAVVPCRLDIGADGVTCPAGRYLRWADRALARAAASAAAGGLEPVAIGISSQAQTFVSLDARGKPTGPAVVWTDDRAREEAAEIGARMPDYARASGFLRPSPLQLLPKLLWMRRHQTGRDPARVLLLNEWVTLHLTGAALGDETLQGMGGLFHIGRREWSSQALALVGLDQDQLADVGPAGARCALLRPAVAALLGVSRLPVFSCGNDQSCGAVGAGIEKPGDVLCNFGTAMIAYTVHSSAVAPEDEAEIAGIHPRSGQSFLLACEPEFGNVIEWLGGLFYGRRGAPAFMAAGSRCRSSGSAPGIALHGAGRLSLSDLSLGHSRDDIARGVVDAYAARFRTMLDGVLRGAPVRRLVGAGGGSRSAEWLDRLSAEIGAHIEPAPSEHAGLAGIARVVRGAL